MNKISRPFTLLLVLLFVALSPAEAKNYTPQSVPNVQVEDYRRFVSNPDGILSAEAVRVIDSTLLQLKQARIAEVAVVAVESIGFAEPREFVTELFRYWGIGEKGRDNGLLVLLVLGQGAIEIETGYGMEGTLPDALCKRVIERMMIPHFKQGDFDSGMMAGVGAIAEVLTSEVVPEELAGNEEEDAAGVAIALTTMVIFVVLMVVLLKLNKRCPKCKKSMLQRTDSRLEVKLPNGKSASQVAYKCKNCGHVVWRNEDGEDGLGGGPGGPIIFGGGFGRGGGFGGGNFGGGFGGGFSGGGGAGGRF